MRANDCVDFDVLPGEIHALLGENGSGKSTLCKILAGLYRPDEGDVLVDGKPVRFFSPRDAYARGVFMVQQHLSLVDQLTVADNIMLGPGPHTRFRYRRRDVESEVAATAERFRLDVDPSAYIWQLSVGERQRVEVLRALYRGARILILDEPTTVLTPQECEHLFTSLRELKANGASVIFVSHKLREVMAVCDRVTVLRKGTVVGAVRVQEDKADPRMLAHLMVGREISLAVKPRSTIPADAPVVLDVQGVHVSDDFGRLRVKDVSFQVRRGEILGVAGVAGNGQRELAEAVTGLRGRVAGTVAVAGRALLPGSARHAIEAGLAYVPEDRLGTGLVGSLRVSDNVILKDFASPEISWGPVIRRDRVQARTRRLIEEFDVRGRPDSYVRQLSGGNAQKVLLAREMSSDPTVLVVAAPTQGLDVGATQSVRTLLLRAAADGVGVVLISEDLDEVLDMADRVAVLYGGRLMGVLDAADADRDRVGLLMAGLEAAA